MAPRPRPHDDTGGRPIGRQEVVLFVIPLVFIVAAVAGETIGTPPEASVGGAGLVAAAIVGDALFRNPPGTGSV